MASAGRGARTRGHNYERNVARWLTEHTATEVRTSREKCKGAKADLATLHPTVKVWVPTVQGWSLELKSTDVWQPDKWLEQASSQRENDVPYAVIADRKHHPIAASWVIEPWPDGDGWWMTTLDQWTTRNMT